MNAPDMADGRAPTWVRKKSYPALPGELAAIAELNPDIKTDMMIIMIDVVFITTPEKLYAANPD